ncbi:Zinc finger protein, partial [Ophiophagus hannah]
LSRGAEEAFQTLEDRDQEDYGKVKAAILRGEALRMEKQRQHFRQFCCQEVGDPGRLYGQLHQLRTTDMFPSGGSRGGLPEEPARPQARQVAEKGTGPRSANWFCA